MLIRLRVDARLKNTNTVDCCIPVRSNTIYGDPNHVLSGPLNEILLLLAGAGQAKRPVSRTPCYWARRAGWPNHQLSADRGTNSCSAALTERAAVGSWLAADPARSDRSSDRPPPAEEGVTPRRGWHGRPTAAEPPARFE